MQIVAFASQKGGVGKTSTAVNMAAILGHNKERVLLIDLDPQGSASIHFGIQDSGVLLLECLEKKTPLTDLVRNVLPGVDLVPTGMALSAAESRFAGENGSEMKLNECLQGMTPVWDWVFIDCPSGRNFLTLTALAAASWVQMMVECNPLSLPALIKFSRTIDMVARKFNPALKILGVLPSRAHPQWVLHKKLIEELGAAFPGKVAPLVIRESVSLAEAAGYGKTVIHHAPRSIGAQDYLAATKWFKKMAKSSS